MKIEFIEKVMEFMEKFSQPINEIETIPTTQQKILRFKLFEEERNELCEAYFYKDEDYNKFLVETADAIVDTMYVLYGIFGDFGSQCYEYDPAIIDKILFENLNLTDDKEKRIKIITFKTLPVFCNELYKSMINNSHSEISSCACFVEYLLLNLGELYGFDIDALFNEVHESNMSKLHDGVVVKNEFGKIVKSPDYKPADIKGILEKNGLLR